MITLTSNVYIRLDLTKAPYSCFTLLRTLRLNRRVSITDLGFVAKGVQVVKKAGLRVKSRLPPAITLSRLTGCSRASKLMIGEESKDRMEVETLTGGTIRIGPIKITF